MRKGSKVTMDSRKEIAVQKRKQGYNCAQAIACTYADYTGVDEEKLYQATQAFGGGMGTMEGTCGAITGACTVLGMYHGTNRMETLKGGRKIMNQFLQQNQSVICKELKGVETGKVLRSCEDCVRDACEILEELINETV